MRNTLCISQKQAVKGRGGGAEQASPASSVSRSLLASFSSGSGSSSCTVRRGGRSPQLPEPKVTRCPSAKGPPPFWIESLRQNDRGSFCSERWAALGSRAVLFCGRGTPRRVRHMSHVFQSVGRKREEETHLKRNLEANLISLLGRKAQEVQQQRRREEEKHPAAQLCKAPPTPCRSVKGP